MHCRQLLGWCLVVAVLVASGGHPPVCAQLVEGRPHVTERITFDNKGNVTSVVIDKNVRFALGMPLAEVQKCLGLAPNQHGYIITGFGTWNIYYFRFDAQRRLGFIWIMSGY